MGILASVARILREDLLHSESALSAAFFTRLYWYCSLRRKLRTLESADAVPMTIEHNLKSLRRRLNRMLLLIKPLSVLEQVPKGGRVLVIGPRNEWDLLLLARHGFALRNQTGLDLISYSPLIKLGDMHAMPFADGEFDVVLCGWTLSYSATPLVACQEMARVCKPGGVIGIGVEYFDGDQNAERKATGGYLLQDERLTRRVNSVQQILDLFPGHGAVHFSHDAPLRRSAPRDVPPSNCAVLFSR
jgi:SAM-dependent methyltransferase